MILSPQNDDQQTESTQLFLPGFEPEDITNNEEEHQLTFTDPTIEELRNTVESELACSAHGLDHVRRVYNLCMQLAKGENLDLRILKAAALLHDIARVREDQDPTGSIDHAFLGAKMAQPILEKLGFSPDHIEKIKDCILSHRFRTTRRPQSKEAQILFDADTLDGIGAIGIARSLVWIGRNNARIFEKMDVREYVKRNMGSRIEGVVRDKSRHNLYLEYETKVKALRSRLYTARAKQIASGRLRYYGNYLRRLEKEIAGEL